MTISMYQASVPRFVNILGNLSNILDKTQAHIDAKKIADASFTAFRLFPDMLPMTTQVQIACDSAKFAVARLSGVDAPKFDDTEVSFTDLRLRIASTLEYIRSVPAAKIDGTENKDIVVPRRDGSMTLKGEVYLKHYSLPNLYFHVMTAYALLRHNGVDLGKGDFLGTLS